MATSLDNRLRPLVVKLLAKKGKAAVYVRYPSKSYNPVTGDTTPGAASSTSLQISPPAPYNIQFVNDTTIKEGDMQTIIAAQGLAFVPANGDLLTFDGETWKVLFVSRLYSGDLVAAYQLQLRR